MLNSNREKAQDWLVENMIHLVSDAAGIYLPKEFCERFNRELFTDQGLEEELDIILSGPEHPEYWDAWDRIYINLTLTNNSGKKYSLYQNGDLWAIPSEFPENLEDAVWELLKC